MSNCRLLVLVALLAACSTSTDALTEPVPTDEELATGQGRTKDEGGPNGDFDYCDGITPCGVGEGDCDSDAQCTAGLVCGLNNGGQFGLHWSREVCVESGCTNGVQDPDESGVDIGGTCGDICSGQNGDNVGYCTVGCPCAEGEGDCDSDDECAPGLACLNNRGDEIGPPLDPLDDVCTDAGGVLGISSLSVGDLVLTEIMSNPSAVTDARGEWFEIVNTTNVSVDLVGLVVRKDVGAASFTVGAVVIGPNAHLVFARNGDPTQNGGVAEDFDYPNNFALGDVADSLVLDSGPLDIDRVAWGAGFPNAAGASMQVDPGSYDAVDNGNGGNWCASADLLSGGDRGSPGDLNASCDVLGVDLGSAGDFVVLGKSAVTSVPPSDLTGDVGISPAAATAITGFSLILDASTEFSTSTQVVGQVFAADYAPPTPAKMTTAVLDMELAFTDAAGRAPDVTELGAGNIGGLTLAAGVYKWGSGLLIPTDLALTGSATDVWIFQIAQDLVVGSGTQITLSGGAVPENVFWQVSGLVDVGTTAHVEGIVLCQTAITLHTGASSVGRLLAQTAVTIDQSTVVEPSP